MLIYFLRLNSQYFVLRHQFSHLAKHSELDFEWAIRTYECSLLNQSRSQNHTIAMHGHWCEKFAWWVVTRMGGRHEAENKMTRFSSAWPWRALKTFIRHCVIYVLLTIKGQHVHWSSSLATVIITESVTSWYSEKQSKYFSKIGSQKCWRFGTVTFTQQRQSE